MVVLLRIYRHKPFLRGIVYPKKKALSSFIHSIKYSQRNAIYMYTIYEVNVYTTILSLVGLKVW